jgi:hypothetical protein
MNFQSYLVSGLCPSSGILITKITTFLKLDLFPFSCEGREPPSLFGSLVLYTIVRILTKLNSMASFHERILPTERPPLVGDVSANFCG